MPRISRGLIAKARNYHPLLPQLLGPCRDLESAKLEFRWLNQHVVAERARKFQFGRSEKWPARLRELCEARGRGVPLQYLLGTEYFGDLELRCETGVLIPRPATAAAVMSLLEWVKSDKVKLPKELKVLDLCAGSGCISLLLGHSFPFRETEVKDVTILGVDVSPKAIRLAETNRKEVLDQLRADTLHPVRDKAIQTVSRTEFKQVDILSSSTPIINETRWDVVISNPPYISPKAFRTTTSRSVRDFEPKLALVPPIQSPLDDDTQGDLFYPKLLDIAKQSGARILLVEVADMAQAKRVAALARTGNLWDGVEIWRDDPKDSDRQLRREIIDGFEVVGEGDGRSVFCWRKEPTSSFRQSDDGTQLR